MTMSNSAVAEAYATGATKGASKNVYINGDSIYSYGPHFPIASRIPDGYIFNSARSSVSTAKHKTTVWRYIHKDILWELPGCEVDGALQVYASRVLEAMERIPKSRHNFPRYLELLEFNFDKAIEASEKLGQNIQPLYDVMDKQIVADAIRRIKKEGKVPEVMLTIFGKAKFLGKRDGGADSFMFFIDPRSSKTITFLPPQGGFGAWAK